MRNLLSPDAIHPAISNGVDTYHNDIVQEVIQAVAANGVVVVGMKQNPVVKKARKSLEAAGIEFTYLEYGSYTSQWCCQTNANQSLFSSNLNLLGCAETAPLSQSGGAVKFEMGT